MDALASVHLLYGTFYGRMTLFFKWSLRDASTEDPIRWEW